MHEELEHGHSVYGEFLILSTLIARAKQATGVTTGFGGSADTSTTSPEALQRALIQMQLCAVLPVQGGNRPTDNTSHPRAVFSNGDALTTLSIPEAWVRGAMLVRCNSLLRGHSAVRLSVIEALVKLLQNDIVPLVPLRGSVSASGDLCPLSYIAGTLEGNPDVYVWSGKHAARKLISADVALHQLNITPVSFGPKEVLGILNGTAVSAAVAALAQHQADNLAVFSQVLTAMGVEALLGTAESFDPFIAAVRPHRGQVEVAQNILSFLKGSKLASCEENDSNIRDGHLRQDRYALRTASQWIGPQVEDLILAREQLEVELNSTTDNPLFDVSTRKVHHGGNFQAVAVTSSTEKTRLALQMIGKLLFAQSTELLDTRLSNGLPPNLAADEPSLSYTFKGVDINMAAYMSELAFLANPVSSHVQSAEMSNQAVNSLALVSARYTHMAIDVLSLMSSAYLYSLCQALDLRAMNVLYLDKLRPAIEQLTTRSFARFFHSETLLVLQRSVWSAITIGLENTTTKDSSDRFIAVAQIAQPSLVQALSRSKQGMRDGTKTSSEDTLDLFSLVLSWTEQVATLAKDMYLSNRETYMTHPDATPFLGAASKRMYKFVREELAVPFHRGLADHPTLNGGEDKARKLKNTGSQISIIYEALRDERLIVPVMECLKEALAKGETSIPNPTMDVLHIERLRDIPQLNGSQNSSGNGDILPPSPPDTDDSVFADDNDGLRSLKGPIVNNRLEKKYRSHSACLREDLKQEENMSWTTDGHAKILIS